MLLLFLCFAFSRVVESIAKERESGDREVDIRVNVGKTNEEWVFKKTKTNDEKQEET